MENVTWFSYGPPPHNRRKRLMMQIRIYPFALTILAWALLGSAPAQTTQVNSTDLYDKSTGALQLSQRSRRNLDAPRNEERSAAIERQLQPIALNFGATEDQQPDRGTLWQHFPRQQKGHPPGVQVEVQPSGAERFSYPSQTIQHGSLRWVAACGLIGATNVVLRFDQPAVKPEPWTIRLIFADTEESVQHGLRVFDIYVQGKQVEKNFDIYNESGGVNNSVVKIYNDIPVQDHLEISLVSRKAGKLPPRISGLEMTTPSPRRRSRF